MKLKYLTSIVAAGLLVSTNASFASCQSKYDDAIVNYNNLSTLLTSDQASTLLNSIEQNRTDCLDRNALQAQQQSGVAQYAVCNDAGYAEDSSDYMNCQSCIDSGAQWDTLTSYCA